MNVLGYLIDIGINIVIVIGINVYIDILPGAVESSL